MPEPLAAARAALETHGLLLLADARPFSLTTLVTGEAVRGSWWSHPKGRAIFAAASALSDDRDVATLKLLSGKVTFVHRRLFPAVLAAATADEDWQRDGLPRASARLLARVKAAGTLRLDEEPDARRLGPPARDLERRLLVHSGSEHTRSGAHARRLETWEAWAGRVKAARGRLSAATARERLEAAARAVGVEREALPWA